MNWKIADTDGNPTKPGTYLCIVIHSYRGCKYAVLQTRYYADLAEEPDMRGWAMTGQPSEGMVWCEETGSYPGETVYAWQDLPTVEEPNLPAGVCWLDSASLDVHLEANHHA
jgi:hypothetical protein